jgi:hypothetical protein
MDCSVAGLTRWPEDHGAGAIHDVEIHHRGDIRRPDRLREMARPDEPEFLEVEQQHPHGVTQAESRQLRGNVDEHGDRGGVVDHSRAEAPVGRARRVEMCAEQDFTAGAGDA